MLKPVSRRYSSYYFIRTFLGKASVSITGPFTSAFHGAAAFSLRPARMPGAPMRRRCPSFSKRTRLRPLAALKSSCALT